MESILPLYFKQTKYKSFQRQLNLYGFTRITDGPNHGGYKHAYFIRGERSLCLRITRTGEKEIVSDNADAASPIQRAQVPPVNVSPMPEPSKAPASLLAIVAALRSTDSSSTTVENTLDYPVAATTCGSRSLTASEQFFKPPAAAFRPENGSDALMQLQFQSDIFYKNLVSNEYQFPWKLWEMLERSTIDSFEHVVSWQPGNDCFKVHDTKRFVFQVMPRFFNQSKYKSFQRQLNIYGFARIEKGPNKGGYQHQFFIKGRKGLLGCIKRQKIKGVKQVTEQTPTTTSETLNTMETESDGSPPTVVAPCLPVVLADIRRSYAMKHSERTYSSSIHEENDGTDSEGKESSKDTIPVSADGLSWRQNPSESFSDWMIEVVDKGTRAKTVYNVHRRVLAAGPKRSEYFARLFRISNSSNQSVLELGPLEAPLLPLVLDHMYADVTLGLNDVDKAYALYCIAEHLEISSILQAVTEFFCQNMDAKNVVDYITLGKEFVDQTLLEAVVEKCAEEIRSMDKTVGAKMDPSILLQVIIKSKTRKIKCCSSRLSQLIAECVQIHLQTLTPELFQQITDEEHLPYIESKAAIRLLSAEKKLDTSKVPTSEGNSSLRNRCIFSIAKDWVTLRTVVENDNLLKENMKCVSSDILFEILMKATGSTAPPE